MANLNEAWIRQLRFQFEQAGTPLLCPRCPRYQGLSLVRGLERRFVDAAEDCEYDRRHNRIRHRRSVHLFFFSLLSFHQVLSLVRL